MGTDNLFSSECNKCGSYIIYADDGLYKTSSNGRNYNQDKIYEFFWKIKDFLNANGLKVNDQKTNLTEFMTYQKRTKMGGIPPDLTIREETKDLEGNIKMQDKLITDNPNFRILGLNLNSNLSWENHLSTGKKSTAASSEEANWTNIKIGTDNEQISQTKINQQPSNQ